MSDELRVLIRKIGKWLALAGFGAVLGALGICAWQTIVWLRVARGPSYHSTPHGIASDGRFHPQTG